MHSSQEVLSLYLNTKKVRNILEPGILLFLGFALTVAQINESNGVHYQGTGLQFLHLTRHNTLRIKSRYMTSG